MIVCIVYGATDRAASLRGQKNGGGGSDVVVTLS